MSARRADERSAIARCLGEALRPVRPLLLSQKIHAQLEFAVLITEQSTGNFAETAIHCASSPGRRITPFDGPDPTNLQPPVSHFKSDRAGNCTGADNDDIVFHLHALQITALVVRNNPDSRKRESFLFQLNDSINGGHISFCIS
ncbi:hypothetical protein D3C78_1596260 [compost metagenome]